MNDYATATGGAELLVLALRDELRRAGHEVWFFASSARPLGAEGHSDTTCFGTTGPFRTMLQSFNVSAWRRLRAILRDFQPDVVYVKLFLTQLSPAILPLLAEVPTLYHVAWHRPICPLGSKLLPDGSICRVRAGNPCLRNRCLSFHDWLTLMAQMRLLHRWKKHINLVVSNSRAVQTRLLKDGFGSSVVVPNGVPVRPARPPLTGPPTMGYSGRLVREKGVDVLLRAFTEVVEKIPGASLIIVGDGPERRALEQLAVELRVANNVTFAGHVPRDESELLLGPAWVQAVPSLWEEPFGLVAAEAMMRGTAVVASAHGGLVDVVREGKTGRLVIPGHPSVLAMTLCSLLENRDLAEAMGKAGREVALAEFSEAQYTKRIEELLLALAERRSRV